MKKSLPLLILSLVLLVGAAWAWERAGTGNSIAPQQMLDQKNARSTGSPSPGVRTQGDDIGNPYLIPGIPFRDEGNSCSFNDDYVEYCPWQDPVHMAPDVVYAYTPAGNVIVNASLCESQYDTKIYIYENSWTSGSPYACNDDACTNEYTDFASKLEAVPLYSGNTYYFVVDGYGYSCGDYVIDITEWSECVIDCPNGALTEDEPVCYDEYVDVSNGGCNSSPPVFDPISCAAEPIHLCGTSGTYIVTDPFWGDVDYRDTDWYEITLNETRTITYRATAQFPVLIFLLDGSGGCDDQEILESDSACPCDEAMVSRTLGPGTYWLWIGPYFYSGVPCGAEYEITIEGLECPVHTENSSWGKIKSLFRD
ncbi:MAG: hypothetical protein JW958_03815 [Candidatus Eisenbacteria bacterium]|nr:hypothetical protein [Candidatus Eisenbacteria bacterium]